MFISKDTLGREDAAMTTLIKTGDTATEMLFVYGTLRPSGTPNSDAPRLLRYVGAATIVGILYDLGAYPGAVLPSDDCAGLEDASRTITGDVFAVSKRDLRIIDEYEGYAPGNEESSWYIRQRVLARRQDGSPLFCWVYEVNLRRFPQAVPIPSGDWVAHCRTKTQWPRDEWPSEEAA
jgi:gamma-glutamylcyclotransferase (GGCT)/AIG2-like uncharacterized protein YtfP